MNLNNSCMNQNLIGIGFSLTEVHCHRYTSIILITLLLVEVKTHIVLICIIYFFSVIIKINLWINACEY